MTIKEHRKGLGMSQAQVAAALGISQPLYSLIETGKKAAGQHEAKLKELGLIGDEGYTKPVIDRERLAAIMDKIKPAETTPISSTNITSIPVSIMGDDDDAEAQHKPGKYEGKYLANFNNIRQGQRVKWKDRIGTVVGHEHAGIARLNVSFGDGYGRSMWPVSECEVLPDEEVKDDTCACVHSHTDGTLFCTCSCHTAVKTEECACMALHMQPDVECACVCHGEGQRSGSTSIPHRGIAQPLQK